VPFILDAQTILNGDVFTFTTTAGDLDCIGTPSGSIGYPDLVGRSVHFDLGEGLVIRVVGLEDLIRIKRATGRRKDLSDAEALEELRALISEQNSP
jgi:hypothetical protein